MMSLDASRLGSRLTPRFKKLRSIEELNQAPHSLNSIGSYSRDDTLMHIVTPDLPVSMLFSPLPTLNQQHNETSWMSLSESQMSRNVQPGPAGWRKTQGYLESPLSSFRSHSRPPSNLRLQSIEELASVESTSPL